ncbi:formylglycine-generating enzyme family protein, partial [Treponema pedis]
LVDLFYVFKASDGNARTVYGRLRQSVELTVTYGRITGGTTTLAPVTVRHGELWDTVRQRIADANPIIKHTNVQWHWQDKNGQPINNYYHIDIGNLPSQTVYAFVRPKITEVGSGALRYNTSINSPFSYEYYPMKGIDAVTGGTIGGFSNGSNYNNEHTVSLAAYRIGETEVTQELYELVMAVNPSYFQGSSHQPASGERQEKRPVEKVSWYDAVAFCNELTCCTIGLGEN